MALEITSTEIIRARIIKKRIIFVVIDEIITNNNINFKECTTKLIKIL